ncbi:hypothetical protein ACFX2J_029639 [Malus domestica]
MAGDVPRPKKRVKKLARKGEREIHLISSQTIEATTKSHRTLAVQALTDMQTKPPTGQDLEVYPVEQVVVEPTVDLVVKEPAAPGSTVVPVLEETSTLAEKNLSLNQKTKTTVVLEKEDDDSEEIMLTSRL